MKSHLHIEPKEFGQTGIVVMVVRYEYFLDMAKVTKLEDNRKVNAQQKI